MVVGGVFASRMTLPVHGPAKRARSRIAQEIAEGWRWLWNHAAVRTLALTIFIFNVTFGAAFSVLVLYSIERLHAGEVGFGLLTTMTARRRRRGSESPTPNQVIAASTWTTSRS